MWVIRYRGYWPPEKVSRAGSASMPMEAGEYGMWSTLTRRELAEDLHCGGSQRVVYEMFDTREAADAYLQGTLLRDLRSTGNDIYWHFKIEQLKD